MNWQSTCETCKTAFDGAPDWMRHMASMQHHIRVENEKPNQTHYCAVCSITLPCIATYSKHVDSAVHQQRASLSINSAQRRTMLPKPSYLNPGSSASKFVVLPPPLREADMVFGSAAVSARRSGNLKRTEKFQKQKTPTPPKTPPQSSLKKKKGKRAPASRSKKGTARSRKSASKKEKVERPEKETGEVEDDVPSTSRTHKADIASFSSSSESQTLPKILASSIKNRPKDFEKMAMREKGAYTRQRNQAMQRERLAKYSLLPPDQQPPMSPEYKSPSSSFSHSDLPSCPEPLVRPPAVSTNRAALAAAATASPTVSSMKKPMRIPTRRPAASSADEPPPKRVAETPSLPPLRHIKAEVHEDDDVICEGSPFFTPSAAADSSAHSMSLQFMPFLPPKTTVTSRFRTPSCADDADVTSSTWQLDHFSSPDSARECTCNDEGRKYSAAMSPHSSSMSSTSSGNSMSSTSNMPAIERQMEKLLEQLSAENARLAEELSQCKKSLEEAERVRSSLDVECARLFSTPLTQIPPPPTRMPTTLVVSLAEKLSELGARMTQADGQVSERKEQEEKLLIVQEDVRKRMQLMENVYRPGPYRK